MIKEDKAATLKQRPLFHPAFGSRPQEIIGRDDVIADFLEGLESPIGSQRRCTFFYGQRGMGKTALLLELADRAGELGFVTARVTSYEGMPDDIVETIQRNGSKFIDDKKRRIQGVEAGAFGFSFGLTFTEETQRQYGFRTKMTLLCDRLEAHGKGVLLLIDEAQTSEAMRQIAVTYQHLVGEDKNIAIAMAGLPSAISGILNDKVLTFLNRAQKVHLGSLSEAQVGSYYKRAFKKLGMRISSERAQAAAAATQGFPYLVQLVGYYLSRYAGEDGTVTDADFQNAIDDAKRDLEENVFQPMLSPLSDNDKAFLQAMAQDDGVTKIASLIDRLGVDNAHIQPYRARLLEAALVESPHKGELVFVVPYLSDYLRKL